MRDERPAKFMIARSVQVDEDPARLDEDGLWSLHREAEKRFYSLLREVEREDLGYLEFRRRYGDAKPSFLDVKIEIAYWILKICRFCEFRCRVGRSGSRGLGVCRLGRVTYVHSWFHHMGEEAPLVPSGTIFYGGCNFRCVYCQNWDISQVEPFAGAPVDARQLAIIQRELRINGARNINHVGGEPTPNIHTILESFRYLDVNVPQLWNSNFYMSTEAMELLKHVIDIWLPDFKYGNDRCALRLSKVPRYFEVVTRNLRIAAENGDMIIRHLVLPNHIECCSKNVLRWIADNLPRERVLVNIMDQYRPEHLVVKNPERYRDMARRPSRRELEEVYSYADKLGLLWRDISR
ncbi:MAG: pyruvate formate lyase-activating protein [Thermoprotei archaeon]|nr:MAG: pyruvate formate lyase-activating protein [Thermoprotei archaeon]